jgi:hypothetical protein
MKNLSDWMAHYNKLTHAITALAAFLLVAYDSFPPFQVYVNQTSLQIYHAVPGWVGQLISIAVALYVWYRKGEPKQEKPVDGANSLKLNS